MIYKLILVGLLATSAACASSIKGARDELATKGDRIISSPIEYQRQRQLQQQVELSKTTRDNEQQQYQYQQEQQRELTKTAPANLEQQRGGGGETSKVSLADTEQRRDEQVVQLAQYQEQQKFTEEYHQQREEVLAPVLTQQKEEVPAAPLAPAPAPAPTKTLRYEAKAQVVEEAPPAKGTKFEFQKVEAQREEGLKTSKLAESIKQEQQQQQQQQKTIEESKANVVYEQQRETFYDQQQQQQQLQLAQQVELKDYDQQRRLDDQQQQQVQFQQVQYQQQQQQQEEQRAVKGGAAPQQPASQVAEPEPYSFDYSVEGSSRRESGDTNGVVRGQYTLQNPDGSSRIVDYVADRDGFRASVNTNEFGTESGSPANVELRSSQPAAQDISLRLEGKTREFLNPPAIKSQAAAPAPAPLPPSKPDNWNVKGGAAAAAVAAPVQQQQVAYIEEIRNTKGAAPVQQQQQQQQVYVEEVRATKGAAAAPVVAKVEQQVEQVKAPVKTVVQRLETINSTPQEAPAVVKSAELRTPKAIGSELRPVAAPVAPVAGVPRLRSGFESATAHRPIIAAPRNQAVHPATIQYASASAIAHPQRQHNSNHQHQHHYQSPAAAITRQYQPLQPIVRAQYGRPQPVASILRSQLQHDRYPPNPVYNYNRNERPLNPRVSFYSNNAETNEDTPIGFGDSS